MTKDNKVLSLFMTFFKIGAFTFGGGYAMIPMIQKETVENKKEPKLIIDETKVREPIKFRKKIKGTRRY